MEKEAEGEAEQKGEEDQDLTARANQRPRLAQGDALFACLVTCFQAPAGRFDADCCQQHDRPDDQGNPVHERLKSNLENLRVADAVERASGDRDRNGSRDDPDGEHAPDDSDRAGAFRLVRQIDHQGQIRSGGR